MKGDRDLDFQDLDGEMNKTLNGGEMNELERALSNMSVLVDEQGNEISFIGEPVMDDTDYRSSIASEMERGGSRLTSRLNGQTFRAIGGNLKDLTFQMRRRTDTKIFADFSIGDINLGMSPEL
jgi:hypothetical protein